MHDLHVIGVGAFGREVAAATVVHLPDRCCIVTDDAEPEQLLSASWPHARLRVVAAWRETPRLFGTADAAAYAWRVPWLPVVLEHPWLRVGPVVVPAAAGSPGAGSACYACWRARSRQHDPGAALTQALHAHYDADPLAGPGGHLPHHVTLAASLAGAVARRLLAGDTATDAGTVRKVHLLGTQFATGSVVAVHGCGRCRAPHHPDRSWRPLAADPRLLAASAPGASRGR